MVDDNGGIREKEPFSLSKANYAEVGFNSPPCFSLRGGEDCKCKNV